MAYKISYKRHNCPYADANGIYTICFIDKEEAEEYAETLSLDSIAFDFMEVSMEEVDAIEEKKYTRSVSSEEETIIPEHWNIPQNWKEVFATQQDTHNFGNMGW